MRGIIRTTQLLACLLVFLFSCSAIAMESSTASVDCSAGQHELSGSAAASEGRKLAQSVSTKGVVWKQLPHGRHGPGDLYCDKCANGQPVVGSYVLIDLQKFRDRFPDYYAANSGQRIQRANEALFTGGSLKAFSGLDLLVWSVRENVKLEDYNGYAVFYEIQDSDSLRQRYPGWNLRNSYLLALHLTDGCMVFDATFAMQDRPEKWTRLLEGLIAELKISKPFLPAKD